MILEAFSMPLSRHLIDEEAMVLDAFSMSLPMSSEKAEPDYSSQAKFSKAGKSKSRKETVPFAIPFDLYYPTDATSGEQAFFEPSYLPGLKHKLDGVLYGATMTQSKKCFPLVIYSHGLNSFPTDNNNLLRRLAENGFIVAAPDHINIGNLKDVIEGDATSLSNLRNGPHDRPRDVSAVLDALLANEEYSSKIQRRLARRCCDRRFPWGERVCSLHTNEPIELTHCSTFQSFRDSPPWQWPMGTIRPLYPP